MTVAISIGLFAVAAAGTALTTGCLLPYLERASMFDRPNDRSLHSGPVPRGAGLAIAGVVLALQAAVLAVAGAVSTPIHAAWWFGGAGFALLGWWDDYRSRSPALRLILQFVIAGAYVGMASSDLPLRSIPVPGYVVFAGATIGVVWIVNLFNFMDGADGFAGTQALLYAVAAVALLARGGAALASLTAVVIAGGALGFLYWNRAPARVFMGDSGSYFLGFQLAALAAVGLHHGQSISPWIVLVALFAVDTTFTLVRRLASGDHWWKAHRTHAFQVLILKGWSANRLVWTFATLTVSIYWPLAIWAALHEPTQWVAVLLALVLAGMIWFMIVRDRPEPASNH